MSRRRAIITALLCVLFSVLSLRAQDAELQMRPSYVQGTYTDIDERGDTAYHIVLKTITVFPEWKFKNKKEEEFYWRTVRDVKKALPYAKIICRTLTETYEYIETLPDTKAREQHLKDMEGAVFRQYKPALKKFNKRQANLLCKLIMRETNQTGYEIIKAFMGNFRAAFWQGFGKLFGVSLKNKFQPEKNREDAIIERICYAVEQGTL
ncbi:MAG: DUF4294 domain-containing protein [Bacteroides sp.]|nr:DUF4294 domain-containing protein [Bacteroides sp.]MCM1379897.1 DUF4294 domain-containing protein [Bacteroides sp.]MCM1446249.1 DUF4294 domain-containing protein [Prevotella sp.]